MKRLLIVLMILFCFAGCSNNNPLGRVAIRGNVTLDGKPLEQGSIQFESMPGVQPTILTGGTIRQGAFSIPAANGLAPDQEYKVCIRSMEEDPTSSFAPGEAEFSTKNRDIVPPQYGRASTLTVNATKKSPNVFNFDMTK